MTVRAATWSRTTWTRTAVQWTLNKTRVIGDGANSWFRVWENNDGGCLFTCPEDDSDDTNFDQKFGQKDTSLKQIRDIKNTTYLGRSTTGISMPATGGPSLPPIVGTIDWSNNNDYFQGALDDFRVYPYAFSDALAANLYKSTSTALDLAFDEATRLDALCRSVRQLCYRLL